ncbi:MAG: hypothetical protein LBL65_05680 [Campylobacteraceae bacterium]|jgi:hypothetical protein|nr:hypothetical protein [Campylobacteraceae bacterium]
MNKIKFSHNYPKLWGQKSAELVQILTLTLPNDMNESLYDYDTTYYEGSFKHHYKLEKGEYLQLLFFGDKRIPFTTIRPRYKGKVDKLFYYMKLMHGQFEIVIAGV